MMTMNLGRLDISAILTVIWAQAISGQTAGGTPLSAAQAVAALPGAPSIVAAAGLTRANERLLALEEIGGVQDPARRLVIVAGLDGRAESAEAVLEALRWFKTDAPAMFRRTWTITALPCANPRSCGTASPAAGRSPGGAQVFRSQVFPPEDGFYNDETSPESRYLWRWVAFQAPDLVLEVRSGQTVSWEVSQGSGALRLNGPRPPSGTLAAAMSTGAPSGLAPVAAVRASTSVDDAPRMLRSVLEAATSLGRSPLHEALLTRVGRTPVEIATLLAHRYPASPAVSYIPAVAWSNTLRLAARLGDAGLVENVRNQMAPFLSGETPTVTEPYRLTSLAGLFAFVDFSEPGQSERALNVAIAGAQFMFSPSTDAILRSPTGWTDDMFMASSLLSRVGARTGDARYGATVGRLLTSYTENLQRLDGLFVHSAGGPHAWGRANGFALLGLTEALTFLPDDWAERPAVFDIYRRHAEALVRHQAPDGMWHQIVDEPGSYRELTVTSMTLVALARGVRLGWLDDSYRSVIDRAWRGIATHIAEDGTVVDASTSTGAGETKQYYLDRTAMFGADERGGAMALWAAVEMDELRRQ
jgi:unsaturated rhamnogalacturonyl hydrolase